MSCPAPQARPTEVVCRDCPAKIPVRKRGGLPVFCKECKARKQNEHVRKWRERKERGETGTRPTERGLGPERPELGMTPEELDAWRCQRAVKLYLDEQLAPQFIAERLGMDRRRVGDALLAAGVSLSQVGRDVLDSLPNGIPG